jgi:hypothetical protein
MPIPPGSANDFHSVSEPASTHYEGQGVEYDRTVKGMSGYWPTASAAGTVVGSQKPFDMKIAPTPEANVTPEGVKVKAQAKGTEVTGGSSMVSVATRIWSGLATWIWVLALLAVGLVVVYFAFPGARPALNTLGRVLASAPPFIGSLVERAVGQARVAAVHTPLVQTVQGGQDFKEAIDKNAVTMPDGTPMPDAMKTEIQDLFNSKMLENHGADSPSSTLIKAIKTTL